MNKINKVKKYTIFMNQQELIKNSKKFYQLMEIIKEEHRYSQKNAVLVIILMKINKVQVLI